MRFPGSRARLALSHLSVLCTIFCLRASATCFYPNGTADNTNTYLPCNPNGPSMCCMTNTATLDTASIDTCRSDGFCIPNDNNGIWRRLCTDQTWKDPACINLCTTGNSVDYKGYTYANATAPLTTCGDRSLCCGSINQQPGQTCCSHRKGVFLQDGKFVSTTTSSLSTATASATTGQSARSTSAASPTPKPASNNTGAIVGGVVGGVAGIVAAALAFWYFMIRRNIRQRSQPEQSYEPYQTGKGHVWQDPSEAPTYERGTRMGELDTPQPRTQELEGRQGSTL